MGAESESWRAGRLESYHWGLRAWRVENGKLKE